MDKNKNNIPVSALYTAATWAWAEIPCADLVTPGSAYTLFRWVNWGAWLYRLINPRYYSLRHQLLHRHTAIDYLLEHASCTRVVEVASGFSPRGSRMSARPQVDYVEVDLPDVIAAKRAQLQASSGGQEVLLRRNFHLKSGDITQLDFSKEFGGGSTAVITEGLMMYFHRPEQMSIWQRIAAFLQENGGLYIFDYIPLSEEPQRSFMGQLLHRLRKHVFKWNYDFVYDDRDREGIISDLHRAGFSQVETFSTAEAAQRWKLPQASVATRTLIFKCRCDVLSPQDAASREVSL